MPNHDTPTEAVAPRCARCKKPFDHGCNSSFCSLMCELSWEALRDRFAAEAPPVPDWFTAEVPAPPPEPPLPEPLSERARSAAEDWRRSRGDYDLDARKLVGMDVSLEEAVSVLAWCEALLRWDDARCDHSRLRIQQRWAQWPWAYADMVLAVRS